MMFIKGYKKFTTKLEEEERRRRKTNKAESALRRNNANKTARMIQTLGWPLYCGSKSGTKAHFSSYLKVPPIHLSHAGAEYITMDPTKQLEEEERTWRLNNGPWSVTAKHNAAVIANILRWNNFQLNRNSGMRRYIRAIENKERRYRLHPDVCERCMLNAYRESSLIRKLGSPFYVQQHFEVVQRMYFLR